MNEMNCPKCNQTMTTVGRPVLTCNGCEGVWLSPEQVNSMLDHSGSHKKPGALLAKGATTTEHACPKCLDRPLMASEQAGMEIDWCDGCHGVYLGKGELSRLREHVSASRFSGDTSVVPTATDVTVSGALEILLGAIGKLIP